MINDVWMDATKPLKSRILVLVEVLFGKNWMHKVKTYHGKDKC